MSSRLETLRQSLLEGQRLIGLFTRFAVPEVAETLAESKLDFLVLDAEHGSFSRSDISRFIFAAQIKGMPVIVRLPDDTRSEIQHAVTVGATGIIIPHLASPEAAARAAAFARTTALERGYAGMGRVSEYRRRSWSSFHSSAASRLIFIAQIDEPEGVGVAAEVAAAAGVDCVFMGRLGLSLAMGEINPVAPCVDEALLRICEACEAQGRRVGMFLAESEAVPYWTARGVNLYAVGSDYGLLLQGANDAAERFSVSNPN